MPKTKRLKQENEDRLSDLPDCLLIHILSCLNTKHAVQTCILATRWKNLWKRIPTLIMHSSAFPTVKHFAIFVSNILTRRDGSTALRSLDLNRYGNIEPLLLKKVVNYVYSHNTHLQHLQISLHGETCLVMRCISSCRTLTSLKLSLFSRGSSAETLFPKYLDLPALTNLELTHFAFCGDENGRAEPFLTFTRLNSLVIIRCTIRDGQILRISNETLVNLAMGNNSWYTANMELFAQSLCTFSFYGSLNTKICWSGLSSVKQVKINAPEYAASVERALNLLSWLQDLTNIESLTVTSIILQILSLVPDLLEVKLPSLCNLKSLEIEVIPLRSYSMLSDVLEKDMLRKAAAKSHYQAAKLRKAIKEGLKPPLIPDGIVDFLRQNSPSAKVNFTTKHPGCFNFLQVKQSIKGKKNINYRSLYTAPASSSATATPASSAEFASAAALASNAAPSFAAPPNLDLCRAEKMANNVGNSDSTLWPDLVTKAFIDIMVAEVTKGNMPNGVFHARTWTYMTTTLNSITNCSYKKEQLEAQMHRLQAMFHEFYSLLQNTRFEWNAETNTVTASEEVWKNYLQTRDKASQFQKKGCDHYKLLEIIFNKNNETEVLHHSSAQDPPNKDEENEIDNQHLNTASASYAHVDNDSSDNDIQEVEHITRSGKRKTLVKDNTSRKESSSRQMGDELAALAQASSKIVEATSSHVTSDCSLTKCVTVLEEIRDISDDIYVKALEKFKDPDWREMFIAMSKDRRRGWLCRL